MSIISAERIYGYVPNNPYIKQKKKACIFLPKDRDQGRLETVTVGGLGISSLSDTTFVCQIGETCLLKCASGACDATTNYICSDEATFNLI